MCEFLLILFQTLIIHLVLFNQRQILFFKITENIHKVFWVIEWQRVLFISIVLKKFTQFVWISELVISVRILLLLFILTALSTKTLVIHYGLSSFVFFFLLCLCLGSPFLRSNGVFMILLFLWLKFV